MMKTVLATFLFLGFAGLLQAQTGSARMVKWSFASKKIDNSTYELRIKAVINGKYHLYAQNVGVEGPVATTFSFTANPMVSLDGKVKELGKVIQKHEAVWDGKVNYFEKEVEFVQTVKLKRNVKTTVAGSVEFMVCDDKECLPPSEVPFKISLGS